MRPGHEAKTVTEEPSARGTKVRGVRVYGEGGRQENSERDAETRECGLKRSQETGVEGESAERKNI